jgi:menaquinone-dependent protoporphyrinogen oxidase
MHSVLYRKTMSARILVAYASKKGSTAEIAHAVARELENRGITVVVAEMNSVTTLETYDALVLRTPMYAGKFLADVPAFIAKHRECIIHIPTAGFVTGIARVYPKAGDPDVIAGALGEAMAPAKPVAVTMFAGKFDPGNQGFLVRSVGKMMKIPEGDFRDWDAISAWARELPGKMGI